ncbi:unnamed protein product [Dibothriocephalus latus]|uniref:Uncharacterized protein n=1 Tax=Dibothriocephalus latus TaxID=60516 RepID=A0A3P6Q7I2_DIBLA|nr:unnamed protein product [Dibothriocephalus latus]
MQVRQWRHYDVAQSADNTCKRALVTATANPHVEAAIKANFKKTDAEFSMSRGLRYRRPSNLPSNVPTIGISGTVGGVDNLQPKLTYDATMTTMMRKGLTGYQLL